MTVRDRVSPVIDGAVHPRKRTAVDTTVILAAGEGSRLRLYGDDPPKPLQLLFGLTLLERAVLRSQAAGATRVLVVLGHEADRNRAALQEIAKRSSVAVEAVDNSHWRAGNGTSALAAESYLGREEPFFLMMCDHVFSRAFLDRLAEQDRGAPCAVVIDRDFDTISDLEGATKVSTEGDYVCHIGKQIEPFDAVDTGVFLCRPPLFDALREAHVAGNDSLSAGVQRLADRGQARWLNSNGLFWQDIDTPEDLALARAGLARNGVFDSDRYTELAGG